MSPVRVLDEDAGPLCGCCTLALANADTSGCEEYCGDGHADRLCNFGLEPGEVAVVGEVDEESAAVRRCVGCGDDFYGPGSALVILVEERS